MSRRSRTNQKSDKSVKITIIVAVIGLIGTLGGAYLNSRATIETKKEEISLAKTQLAIQANSTNSLAVTQKALPTNTPVPTIPLTKEATITVPSEIFVEDFSKGSLYWTLGSKSNDSQISSLSIFDNSLRWQLTGLNKTAVIMGYPNLPITSNIDTETTLNFIDGSEGVEYGLMFRRTNSGSYCAGSP